MQMSRIGNSTKGQLKKNSDLHIEHDKYKCSAD